MSNALNVKNLEIEEQKTQEYFLINRGLGTVTETPINIEVVKDSTNQLVAMADGKSIGNVDTFDYTQIILSELSSLFEVQSNPVYRIKSSDGNEYILKAPFMSKDEVSISLAKVIKKMYQKIKQGELNDQVLINTVTSLTNSSFANPNRNEHEIKNIIDRKTQTYTVKYIYNDSVFAILENVAYSQTIKEPSLKPTENGYWNYDFSKPITDNIEIIWVE